ncbi:MAG: hypothetical protein JXR48_13995 [Candidatus Delongbacteria bacterium]|nr:hypothetical protein [Candidatus Delongbacteria bacterium]MBN2836067.1 hypothetical protein [Candidatus Delongbacteria bacterium]
MKRYIIAIITLLFLIPLYSEDEMMDFPPMEGPGYGPRDEWVKRKMGRRHERFFERHEQEILETLKSDKNLIVNLKILKEKDGEIYKDMLGKLYGMSNLKYAESDEYTLLYKLATLQIEERITIISYYDSNKTNSNQFETKIKKLVTEQFELKEELRKIIISKMEKRLEKQKEFLGKRMKNKEDIIVKRIKDIIEGKETDVEW